MIRAVAPESCKVYTPRPLAKAMVEALGDSPGLTWLEPSFGQGIFLDVLRAGGVNKRRITAVDLDTKTAPSDRLATTFRGKDFLQWSRQTQRRFDRIVGNPPYIPLSGLASSVQDAALMIQAPGDLTIGLGGNTWCAFVCASLRLLKPKAAISFVLPAAWDYADYASALRKSIASMFERFSVYRCLAPMFEDVQDGSVVIVGLGFGLPNVRTIRREFDHPEDLISALSGRQPGRADNTRVEDCSRTTEGSRGSPGNRIRLEDVLQIGLGGVTGDASYFLMTEEQRLSRGLPRSVMKPVLSKARHLTSAHITRDQWKALCASGERIWLFCPPDGMADHPAVRDYLALDPKVGGCNRKAYKIRNRDPWYRTPLPARIDGFLSGMSSLGPCIFFRAMPRLTATNTLYTIRFRRRLPEQHRYAWALALLTTRVRKSLGKACRVYADGLRKYEPADIGSLVIPKPKRSRGSKPAYLRAVGLLLRGKLDESARIANRFVR